MWIGFPAIKLFFMFMLSASVTLAYFSFSFVLSALFSSLSSTDCLSASCLSTFYTTCRSADCSLGKKSGVTLPGSLPLVEENSFSRATYVYLLVLVGEESALMVLTISLTLAIKEPSWANPGLYTLITFS